MDNLRKRMPRNHPAYNQATTLLEVKYSIELIGRIRFLFFLEYQMAKLMIQLTVVLWSDEQISFIFYVPFSNSLKEKKN